MVKRLSIILLCAVLAVLWLSNQSQAWFDAVANWDNIYIAAANDFDTTPTYHADTGEYVVSGAGTSGLNGTYSLSVGEVSEGRPVYRKTGCQIIFSSGSWYMIDDAHRYLNASTSLTPPLIGWQTTNGVNPAPTIAGGVYVDSPDGVTVSQNLTFRVALRPISPATITSCKIQYKKVADGLWYDLTPTYTSAKTVIDFMATQTAFGEDRSTVTQYAAAASARFRIYATDGITENADPTADSSEDGTNGWEDEWVLGCVIHATNSKPPAPTEDN